MSTLYVNQLTLITPENKLGDVNDYICCCMDLSLSDLNTAKTAQYVNLPSNKKYCVISTMVTDEQLALFANGDVLTRPKFDSEDQVNMTKANGNKLQKEVFEYQHDEEGNVTNSISDLFPLNKMVVIPNVSPRQVISDSGLTLITEQ